MFLVGLRISELRYTLPAPYVDFWEVSQRVTVIFLQVVALEIAVLALILVVEVIAVLR